MISPILPPPMSVAIATTAIYKHLAAVAAVFGPLSKGHSFGQIGMASPLTTFAEPDVALLNLLTYALLAIGVSGSIAAAYRWYTREDLPDGIAIIFGVSVVALYLNTASLGSYVAGETVGLFESSTAFFNLVSLGLAMAVSPIGKRLGIALATYAAAMAHNGRLQGEMSEVVRSVGRVTPVTLPEADEIHDIDTYDPVASGTKERMSEETLLFPRRITLEVLQERLIKRIRDDYGVGHVDLELSADGTVEYLGVGSRAAGIGPSLAPGMVAIAVRSDPPYAATPGDFVQLWTGGASPERVTSGELRAATDDIVTIALDEADVEDVDGTQRYRLVTVPGEPQAERQFASLLRSAEETMRVVSVSPDSDRVGTTIADLDPLVAAVRSESGSIVAIPPGDHTIAAGDELYLVGQLAVIRQVERRLRGTAETETNGSQSS